MEMRTIEIMDATTLSEKNWNTGGVLRLFFLCFTGREGEPGLVGTARRVWSRRALRAWTV